MAALPGDGGSARHQTLRRLQWTVLSIVGAMVAVQPVGADDLWWQLSRGRAVWEGSTTPSATLLVLESRAEADWLGGLPAYALYQALGVHGWMLWRVFVVAGIIVASVRMGRMHPLLSPLALLLVSGTLLAFAEGFSPLPRMFDWFGIAFTAWWCWPALNRSWLGPKVSAVPFGGRRLGIVAIGYLCWANVGPAVAAGAGLMLAAAICASLDAGKKGGPRWCEFGVAIAFGSLNPRGIFAWSDSLASLVPSLVTPSAILDGTPWEVLHTSVWGAGEWMFLGLTVAWIASRVGLRRRAPHSAQMAAETDWPGRDGTGANPGRARRSVVAIVELLPFAWMQWLAWSAVQNVSLAAIWIAVDLARQWRATGWWYWQDGGAARAQNVASSEAQADGALVSTHGGTRRFGATGLQYRYQRLGIVAVVALIAGVLLLSDTPSSVGWGIAERLDYRLLNAALQEAQPYGTALTDDVRSTGMLAWLLPQLPRPRSGAVKEPLRLQDVPTRAVTAGRFSQHQQLLDDLRRGRLMRYWRDDGTAGGYWLELRARKTTLLCVSARRVDLIAGLEPSIWKPLSLDSPVLPYAAAGDEAYMKRLIEILHDRETVEYGAWDYELPMTVGSPFDRDWFGLRPAVPDPEQIGRQAAVFRAMDLHYAALRVLFVGRREYPEDEGLAAEVVRCQVELADQEWIDAGRTSWFRYWASRYDAASGNLPPFEPPPQRAAAWPSEGNRVLTARDEVAVRRLKPRLESYLRVGPAAWGDEQWAAEHPQLLYAALCGAIEAGDFERADRLIEALRDRPRDPSLQALVDKRDRELHPATVADVEQP